MGASWIFTQNDVIAGFSVIMAYLLLGLISGSNSRIWYWG